MPQTSKHEIAAHKNAEAGITKNEDGSSAFKMSEELSKLLTNHAKFVFDSTGSAIGSFFSEHKPGPYPEYFRHQFASIVLSYSLDLISERLENLTNSEFLKIDLSINNIPTHYFYDIFFTCGSTLAFHSSLTEFEKQVKGCENGDQTDEGRKIILDKYALNYTQITNLLLKELSDVGKQSKDGIIMTKLNEWWSLVYDKKTDSLSMELYPNKHPLIIHKDKIHGPINRGRSI